MELTTSALAINYKNITGGLAFHYYKQDSNRCFSYDNSKGGFQLAPRRPTEAIESLLAGLYLLPS